MTTDVCEVVITGPSAEWLATFTKHLVDERLAACGHHVESIRSIYRWRGEVHDEREARVALHTRSALVRKIVEEAGAQHPYDVPCVIALPIASGNPEYIRWILDETREV
ncbi:divalent-cation tolerance protein CutA [Polymorphospora sp. NPDC051019]|uniref:divalent-cation tolerance protein CutA n=1 Tax=Polymorphospora sp. NPDC051019 TaxID=3155725 RepID=UPI0034138DF1